MKNIKLTKRIEWLESGIEKLLEVASKKDKSSYKKPLLEDMDIIKNVCIVLLGKRYEK